MFRPWVAVLTSLHSTPIAARIWGAVAVSILYAALICWIEYTFFNELVTHGSQFYAVLGLVLGTLLVFRTNTSYDRWWEGRKLWGQLVNDSRNLAIKIQTCVQAEPREKILVAKQLSAFALALKEHLRDGVQLRTLPGFADATETPSNVPQFIATTIYDRIERWRRNEQLGGFELLFLDPHAAALMNICGGCERIKKTPIAGSYRTFIRQSIALYLVTLPWGIVDLMHWWIIVVVPA